MQESAIHSLEFRKEHTWHEIFHYILDFESPPLTLKVRLVYHVAKAFWILCNVVATLGSILVLVLTSLPEFYNADTDQGNVVLDIWGVSELLCVIFFTLDYLVRMYLSPLTKLKFALDANNMIDMLTTLPYYIQLFLIAISAGGAGFRIVFLLRTFRLIKLARYHPGLEIVLRTIRTSADLLFLFGCIAALAVTFIATVFFYTENSRYNTSTGLWMRPCPYAINLYNKNCTELVSPYQSIPDSMYWAVVTLSTVGYRGQTPGSTGGQIIAVLTAVLGVLFFAAPATVLSTNYKLLRRRDAAAQAFKKIDMRTTAAMLAQERLKKEMVLAEQHRNSNGRVRFRSARKLTKVAEFTFEGFLRPIYEVVEESYYVYPPILSITRDETGQILWQDDFNPTTAQRTLSMLLVLDSDLAREAAREALSLAGCIGRATTENEVLIIADPNVRLEVRHDFELSYPNMVNIVKMDRLTNVSAYHQDVVPIRFIVPMPHLYPSCDVIELLKETRLDVTMLTPMASDLMDVPLVTDVIMATRFVRELSEIAYHRTTDGALIAYIHESDAAELLSGFTEQFMPVPVPTMLITQGYYVDNQVLNAITTSFPRIRLEQVSSTAANSFYRGQHLSIDLAEEQLLEVNLTALAAFDELGFGHRFHVEVPVDTVEREDVQFQVA
jgi:hypothetical protein